MPLNFWPSGQCTRRCGFEVGFPRAHGPTSGAYTLINPDLAKRTVGIDFAMHDGIATQWASAAQPGDNLNVTVLGSKFAIPEPGPAGCAIVGDSASLPAINSLLEAIGDALARVFLEANHGDDREIPTARTDIVRGDRYDDGASMVKAVGRRRSTPVASMAGSSAITELPGWLRESCTISTTSRASGSLREPTGSPAVRLITVMT